MVSDTKKTCRSIHDKKGGTIVEAAVVLPVVSLAVVAVIFILSAMFQQVSADAAIHVALNEAAGRDSDTVKVLDHVADDIDKYSSGNIYYGEKQLFFRKGGLLTKRYSRTVQSRTYIVDEKKYIRYADFFRSREEK